MFKRINLFAAQRSAAWWWGIQIGVLVALAIWWWIEIRPKDKNAWQPAGQAWPQPPETEIPLPEEPAPAAQTPLAATREEMKRIEGIGPKIAAPAIDDLKRIEGIGPKIAATLVTAGITTYAQLAELEPAAIQHLLSEAGVRLGFPGSWPAQAALAARGDWAGLAALQSTLKGGRQVD